MVSAVQLCLLDQNQCLILFQTPANSFISPSGSHVSKDNRCLAGRQRHSNVGKHEDIKLNPSSGVGGGGSLMQLPQFLLGYVVKNDSVSSR